MYVVQNANNAFCWRGCILIFLVMFSHLNTKHQPNGEHGDDEQSFASAVVDVGAGFALRVVTNSSVSRYSVHNKKKTSLYICLGFCLAVTYSHAIQPPISPPSPHSITQVDLPTDITSSRNPERPVSLSVLNTSVSDVPSRP